MAITYSFDTGRSLILTQISGVLALEDTFDYFEKLEADERCPHDAIEIVDFSAVTDFKLQYSEARRIAQNYQSAKASRKILATVFQCDSELSYGIGRMLQMVHDCINPEHIVYLVRSHQELEEKIRLVRPEASR